MAMRDRSAFPQLNPMAQDGMSVLQLMSCFMTDDFEELQLNVQISVVPEYKELSPVEWLATGRAKWRLMQAQALLEEINKIK